MSLVSVGRYGDSYDRWSRKDDHKKDHDRDYDDERSMKADPAPAGPDRDMTGDEAYQRRTAMSRGVRPFSPPAQNQVYEKENLANQEIRVPPQDETGEEAYLRRLAISTMHRQQDQGTTIQERAPTPSPQIQQPRQKSVSPPPLSFNPFAPPSVPPPPGPPALGGALVSDIEGKKKAAVAIAARLGALATLAPQPTAVESSTIAEDASKGWIIFLPMYCVRLTFYFA